MREVYVELTEIQLSATHTLKNESERKKQRETGVIGKYPGIIEQLPDIFSSHHLALEVQQALILLQKYPKSQETNGFLGFSHLIHSKSLNVTWSKGLLLHPFFSGYQIG